VTYQIAVTILAEVRAGEVEGLQQSLADARREREAALPFEGLPVHFARFVVLDPTQDLDGEPLAPRLVFMSDIDSPLDDYLERLADAAGPGLDRIYRHCVDYPDAPGPDDRVAYLRARIIKTDAAYINTVGRSLDRVRNEAQLHRAIEDFLDSRRWTGVMPADVRAAVQGFVRNDPALRPMLRPPKSPGLRFRIRGAAHFAVGVLVGVLLLPFALLALPFLLVVLWWHEWRDKPSTEPLDQVHAQQLASDEGFLAQNQISAVGYLKPGGFRRLVIGVVLWGLAFSSRHIFNNGSLAGIRTIHFARWVFLDDKRRLIFASNYDGSLESYMDDFIDKVAWGLNAAFSNGVGYPRTRWLVFGGSRDEPAFKAYLRNHQIPTQIWYSAYGDLTAVNIANNAAIRAGLHGRLRDDELDAWLRRL
jgi:hypothetical protein